MKRQTRSRIKGENEELDTKVEIDIRGLEEEEAEKLREEESENDKEESSEEEIREKKRRDTIRLLKIIGNVVKKEEIRQFVEKVQEDSYEGKHQEDLSKNGKHACRSVIQLVFN